MLFAVPLVALSSVGVAQANDVHGRTVVVHVTTFDATRVTNALLFAKHSCQFLPDAADTTMRILFTNAGVLNAAEDLNHPINTVFPHFRREMMIRKMRKAFLRNCWDMFPRIRGCSVILKWLQQV